MKDHSSPKAVSLSRDAGKHRAKRLWTAAIPLPLLFSHGDTGITKDPSAVIRLALYLGKIALPRLRMGPDALAVDTTSASDNALWPGRLVLALAAVILFAGYAVAVLRPAPAAVDIGAVVR